TTNVGFDDFKTLVSAIFCPHFDLDTLRGSIRSYKWDPTRLVPVHAFTKLQEMNLILPDSDVYAPSVLKEMFVHSCSDPNWQALAKSLSYTAEKLPWNNSKVSAITLANVMHLQHNHIPMTSSGDSLNDINRKLAALTENMTALSKTVHISQRERSEKGNIRSNLLQYASDLRADKELEDEGGLTAIESHNFHVQVENLRHRPQPYRQGFPSANSYQQNRPFSGPQQ
ncbi:hypothetical protein HDU67_005042, partial [Dinochytrium kinnereticum]